MRITSITHPPIVDLSHGGGGVVVSSLYCSLALSFIGGAVSLLATARRLQPAASRLAACLALGVVCAASRLAAKCRAATT